MATPTARDAAAVQRLWRARELSDGDVDRALTELTDLAKDREEAKRIIRQLVEVWPRDLLRRADELIESTRPPAIKPVVEPRRW